MARMLAGLVDAACDWVVVGAALAPLARSSSRKRSSSWSVLIVCRLELSWPITVLAIDILNFCSLQDKTRPGVEDSARDINTVKVKVGARSRFNEHGYKLC